MCQHKTEVYSRVVGYYRPVQQWNKGKQAEYQDRVAFKVDGKGFCNMGAVQPQADEDVKSA
jgi:ribonucleoside-triphosphate reductase (formate)